MKRSSYSVGLLENRMSYKTRLTITADTESHPPSIMVHQSYKGGDHVGQKFYIDVKKTRIDLTHTTTISKKFYDEMLLKIRSNGNIIIDDHNIQVTSYPIGKKKDGTDKIRYVMYVWKSETIDGVFLPAGDAYLMLNDLKERMRDLRGLTNRAKPSKRTRFSEIRPERGLSGSIFDRDDLPF
jgi:hypothetical protein